MSHPIEQPTANPNLGGLRIEPPCAELAPEHPFESEHRRFRQRATMITRLALPLSATLLTNEAQILIPRQRRRLAIAMLLDRRIPTGRNVDLGVGRMAGQHGI